MKKETVNSKRLRYFFLGALILSYIISTVNTIHEVRVNLFGVLVIGFLSCLAFLFLCIFLYPKVAKISFSWALFGVLIAAVPFFIINFIINIFQDLSYLFGHGYEQILWLYILLLYFISNVIWMYVMRYIFNKQVVK